MNILHVPDRLYIEVEQRHIDEGCKEDLNNCPIALATMEHLHENGLTEWENLSVDSQQVRLFHKRAVEIVYETSYDAKQFIDAFDNGEVVYPSRFLFELEEH